MDIVNKVRVRECKSSCGMITWAVYYDTTKVICFTSEVEANDYANSIKKSIKEVKK